MAKTTDLLALMNDEPLPAKRPEASEDLMRKLAQLNPQLKAGDSTDNFVLNAQGTLQKAAPTPKKDEPPPLSGVHDTDHLVSLSHERFESERREVELQLSVLQGRLAKMKETYLNELLVEMHRLDRNLSSPITLQVLKERKTYLDHVGFTPQKLLDFTRRRRA
jgi:hypothetical protein